MTKSEYDDILKKCRAMTPYKRYQFQGPFSLEESEREEYHIDGYEVTFDNGYLLSVNELSTGKQITLDMLTSDPAFTDKSEAELTQMVSKIQNELNRRRGAQAQKAIDRFMESWKELQEFGDVQVRLDVRDRLPSLHEIFLVKQMGIEIYPVQ